MFSHRDIYKYTWTSPEGKTQNHIDHVLIDRRRHSIILDIRSFRGADCDSDHHLVVAKVRERLAVSKRAAKNTDMDKFNLNKLNEGEVKEQYHVTIRDKFSVLENLKDNGDIIENIQFSTEESIGHCESKHHKPWFDEKYSKLVDRRKQAKLKWSQDPSEVNEK
jgi:hypothetical protein